MAQRNSTNEWRYLFCWRSPYSCARGRRRKMIPHVRDDIERGRKRSFSFCHRCQDNARKREKLVPDKGNFEQTSGSCSLNLISEQDVTRCNLHEEKKWARTRDTKKKTHRTWSRTINLLFPCWKINCSRRWTGKNRKSLFFEQTPRRETEQWNHKLLLLLLSFAFFLRL